MTPFTVLCWKKVGWGKKEEVEWTGMMQKLGNLGGFLAEGAACKAIF